MSVLIGEVAKMAEQEDPELFFSHGYVNMTTVHRATVYENNLKTSREYFPKLKTLKKRIIRDG